MAQSCITCTIQILGHRQKPRSYCNLPINKRQFPVGAGDCQGLGPGPSCERDGPNQVSHTPIPASFTSCQGLVFYFISVEEIV
jgi:hypothetical protein